MPQQTIFIVGAQTVRGLGCSQSSELLAAVLTACFVASFIIQILVHICGYIWWWGTYIYVYACACRNTFYVGAHFIHDSINGSMQSCLPKESNRGPESGPFQAAAILPVLRFW